MLHADLQSENREAAALVNRLLQYHSLELNADQWGTQALRATRVETILRHYSPNARRFDSNAEDAQDALLNGIKWYAFNRKSLCRLYDEQDDAGIRLWIELNTFLIPAPEFEPSSRRITIFLNHLPLSFQNVLLYHVAAI